MHYCFSHFHPYHAVQLKLLAEQWYFVWPVILVHGDSGFSILYVILLRLLRPMFLFDVLIHYCKKYTQEWLRKLKFTYTAAATSYKVYNVLQTETVHVKFWIESAHLCLRPFIQNALLDNRYGNEYWVILPTTHSPIQNVVPRASFDNVKKIITHQNV